jgi:hypothetical protein
LSGALDIGSDLFTDEPSGARSATVAESCYDIPRLLQAFEGLGDNCDFGVLQQRAVGIEQFGLFRFATCKPSDVTALLRARFDYLGEPDDLWLDPVEPRREFWVKSRRCSFEAHTDRFADRDDAEVIRLAQIEKIRYLKTRLIRDLSRGRRLCVWRGPADRAAMQEMAVQLRAYAPNNCLLWVTVDRQRAAGSVERGSDELILGFLSRYGDYEGGPRLPVVEWITVCANAYRLWRNVEPPKATLDNVLSQAVAANSCRWFADQSVTSKKLDEHGPGDGAVFEHRLGQTAPAAVCGALLPISAGGSFAFSAWVRIPEGFRGRQISAVLGGFDSIADWAADPLSYGHWQRIWVTATLPLEAREISCAIMADGAIGNVVQSASWCLERGYRPTGYGFAL